MEVFLNKERRSYAGLNDGSVLWLSLFEGLKASLDFEDLEQLPEEAKAGGMTVASFLGVFQQMVLFPLSCMPIYTEALNQIFSYWKGRVEIVGKVTSLGFKLSTNSPDLKKLFEYNSRPSRKKFSKY